jgi:hypothetical protein
LHCELDTDNQGYNVDMWEYYEPTDLYEDVYEDVYEDDKVL